MGRTTQIGPTQGAIWRAGYTAGRSYYVGDSVLFSGKSYICVASHNGFPPPNTQYWDLLAEMKLSSVYRLYS